MKQTFFMLAVAVTLASCNNTNTKTASEKVDSTASMQQTTADSDLFGTEWKLLELNGKTIKLDTTFNKEPILVFEKD